MIHYLSRLRKVNAQMSMTVNNLLHFDYSRALLLVLIEPELAVAAVKTLQQSKGIQLFTVS